MTRQLVPGVGKRGHGWGWGRERAGLWLAFCRGEESRGLQGKLRPIAVHLLVGRAFPQKERWHPSRQRRPQNCHARPELHTFCRVEAGSGHPRASGGGIVVLMSKPEKARNHDCSTKSVKAGNQSGKRWAS